MSDETTKKAVGEALRAMREARGYSMTAAAQALGESPTALSRWENGHVMPGVDKYARAAALYGSTTLPPVSDSDEIVARARALEAKINKRR